MRRSKVLQRLRANRPVLVPSVVQFQHPRMVEMIGQMGFDCVWIDNEHGTPAMPDLANLLLACRATDMDGIVRIPKGGYTSVMQPVEQGAAGIIVPHIRSADEAAEWASYLRFPPRGRRGLSWNVPDARYLAAADDLLAYVANRNSEVFLVVQIEDVEAVPHLDAIAAVPGVDVLFIGPSDLSMSLGVFPEMGHAKVQAVVEQVSAAAARHGKHWGMPVGTPEEARRLIDLGARFISHSSDVRLLRSALQSVLDDFGGLFA